MTIDAGSSKSCFDQIRFPRDGAAKGEQVDYQYLDDSLNSDKKAVRFLRHFIHLHADFTSYVYYICSLLISILSTIRLHELRSVNYGSHKHSPMSTNPAAATLTNTSFL